MTIRQRIHAADARDRARQCAKGHHPHILRPSRSTPWLEPVCLDCHKAV